jgi:hypothetical protein
MLRRIKRHNRWVLPKARNRTADTIGHDKPTMTYGLYSGGASLKVKREAIEKLA